MNRQKINYVLDATMFLVFVVNLLSLLLHDKELHGLTGYLFAILLLAHLFLHRKWLATMTKNLFSTEQK
ncbi:MAG: hypothetical protein WC310_00045 [Patescibacteria group bacterium]|jgi:hypothetical protein